MANNLQQIPRPGMCATVRNRRGIITAVEPFDGDSGRLHLVHLDYKDDLSPPEERLLWELEPHRSLLEPNALPDTKSNPMPIGDYDALLRAVRWTASNSFTDRRLSISGPFHSAVQIEDFQLVPLLKAMRMPRVNLLIADDVGLGKTVEAGLILTELLLQRRIQRVLILTPASLRQQWRDEMWEKFSLRFDKIDRAETQQIRRRMGMDANPWRAFSRIITSYHYLKQPDICDQFLTACHTPEGSPHLPWDLLIVDECHNLMPSGFGEDSDLCKMIRLLAPKFEHRIFLSATPHNGHTRCFTGLLEILDPVSFTQTDVLKSAERERIEQIVIRRLKREINERTNPPKFCSRNKPVALTISLSNEEIALSDAFHNFRQLIRKLIAAGISDGGGRGKRRRAGMFAVEILGKRLLSCPIAFADSWKRCRQGMSEDENATESDVIAARNEIDSNADDDRETQSREATASVVIGAWLKNIAQYVPREVDDIDQALTHLGIDFKNGNPIEQNPKSDARFNSLISLIDELLRENNQWKDDERIIVFTEYKTTLDYLIRRLLERYDSDRILTLFGGLDDDSRNEVKQKFNDPAEPVRILVATDAAAEGLNLQWTARYMLHFDCPWNPSRLEQRNGRIDRHGQARDVTIYHFVSESDQDLAFLSHVIRKADDIREDLGSANELFDEAAHRRLIEGESADHVKNDLDRNIEVSRKRASFKADASVSIDDEGRAGFMNLDALASELDLDSESLRETLESAMAMNAGRPQLESRDGLKTWSLVNPGISGWTDVIDDSLRRSIGGGRLGPVRRLAFNADALITEVAGRQIFSPRVDVSLLHLSHPMIQHSVSALTRRRYSGSGNDISRWTVRTGKIPADCDALILLNLEELGINDLRETFHHWVQTIIFPVNNGELGAALKHMPTSQLRNTNRVIDTELIDRARNIFEEIEPELKSYIRKHSQNLTSDLKTHIEIEGNKARENEEKNFRSRQAEVSKLIADNTLAKLEREIEELKLQQRQGFLFDADAKLDELDHSINEKKNELSRRTRHYEEIREQLTKERERIMKNLLPKRFAMSVDAQVFPVSIEIQLPGGAV